MAAQTCTWDGAADSDWSNAGNWNTSVEADRVPVNGDAVVIAGAVDCNMPGGAVPAAGNYTIWVMGGYSGAFEFAGSAIDVDGAVTIVAGSFTDSGTGSMACSDDFTLSDILPDGFTVTHDGTGNISANVSGNKADLVIDNGAGTATATTTAYWDSFLLTAGTYVDGGLDHTIAGSILRNGGTLTSTGEWTMSANGDAHWGNDYIDEFVIGLGASANFITERNYLHKISGTGTATQGSAAGYPYFREPDDNFWGYTGAIFASHVGLFRASVASAKPIGSVAMTLANKDIRNYGGSWVAGADIDIGSGSVGVYANASILDMATYDLTCGTITMGIGASDDTLDLGTGSHAIANIAPGSAVSGTLTLDLATSTITLSGTFNPASVGGGSVIGVTGNALGGLPATIEGGTISNVDVSATAHIDARGIGGSQPVDGGSNDNVRFARGLVGGGVI